MKGLRRESKRLQPEEGELMATVTNSRRYSVSRSAAFSYLTNPTTWPDYYSGVVAVTEPAQFGKPGDTVDITYSLLGRRVEASVTVDEIRDGEMIRHTAVVPGLPDVHQTWTYRDAGDGLLLEASLTTEEATSFFGRAIDRLVIPRALQRDIDRTLGKLEDVFSLGVPEA
jgi:hypothetical protein